MLDPMHLNLNSKMSTRRWGRVTVAVLATAIALAGCGSDDTATTKTAKPAGAKENAAAPVAAVCYDLYIKGQATPCAENTIGPGGGVIFYDAGSVQSWGRFLEAAPWNWNPQLNPTDGYKCHGGCSAATSVLNPPADRQQDGGIPDGGAMYTEVPRGYKMLNLGNFMPTVRFTGTALGSGRENTRLLLADPFLGEPLSGQDIGAVDLVASYRGGGKDDWFVPSKDELDLLYRFGNRSAIGGFSAKGVGQGVFPGWGYLSSSVFEDEQYHRRVFSQLFGSGEIITRRYNEDHQFLVRPIRAFS